MRRAEELFGARQRHGCSRGRLPRPGRERRASLLRVQVRRQRAGRYGDTGARRERERLVQRADRRGLLRNGPGSRESRRARPPRPTPGRTARPPTSRAVAPTRPATRGNKALGVKYDATAPQVTASPGRAAGATGWYTAPVAVGFAATDVTSGVDTCDADKTYSGPDSVTAAVGGACRDKAGNSGSSSLPLKYDAAKPTVTAAPSRPAGTNGWYSAPVSVSFTGSDVTSGLDTCDTDKTYSGPDAASTAVGGACRDKAGNTQSGQLPLKYDATAPQVTLRLAGRFRRERLVQPRALRLLLRRRRDGRRRHVRRREVVLRPRQRRGHRDRKLPRQGGQRGECTARVQVRRERAGRHGSNPVASAGRRPLVQPACLGAVPGSRRDVGCGRLYEG